MDGQTEPERRIPHQNRPSPTRATMPHRKYAYYIISNQYRTQKVTLRGRVTSSPPIPSPPLDSGQRTRQPNANTFAMLGGKKSSGLPRKRAQRFLQVLLPPCCGSSTTGDTGPASPGFPISSHLGTCLAVGIAAHEGALAGLSVRGRQQALQERKVFARFSRARRRERLTSRKVTRCIMLSPDALCLYSRVVLVSD